MKRNKISIIGAGNVGATVAQRLAEKNLADIVLLDIPKIDGIPQGKALDIAQSSVCYGYDSLIGGTIDYKDTQNSDIVVITAGIPRKPGMSRDDLISINAKIMKEVVKNTAKFSPNSIIIVVSNPLDAMCHIALEESQFPHHRVIGMAGVLDSARMAHFIADMADVSIQDVSTIVLGGHGDTMVPLTRYCTIAGVPIRHFLSQKQIDSIVERTANGGAEIVKFLKTGSAYYAPSASVTVMVEAILQNTKRIFPCATYLTGEYGISGLYIGVPIKLGYAGVEEVIVLDLDEKEKCLLNKSADAVRKLVEHLSQI